MNEEKLINPEYTSDSHGLMKETAGNSHRATYNFVTKPVKPIVTAGVCVKNCESSIGEVIRSILDQDFPHELTEVIFVDDGSEDRTLSVILDSISKTDLQAKVYHSKWRGLGPARNIVVKAAEGDYIVWVDGDMVLSKDFVRKQVEFMEKNPGVAIAKGLYGVYRGKSTVATLESIYRIVEALRHLGKAVPRALGTGGSIYRVKAIREIGGFDDFIRGAGEDVDAENRIRAAGWSLYLTEATFYERYRETWKDIWNEYFWHGYGMYKVLCKDKNIIKLYRMVPPSVFLWGLIYSFMAYRLIRRKIVFLLPLHCAFVMAAWCLGLAKGQIDSRDAQNRR